jgi:hypothetical protein
LAGHSSRASPLYDFASATCSAILEGNRGLVLATHAVAAAARHPYLTGLPATLATTAVAALEVAGLLIAASHAVASRATNLRHYEPLSSALGFYGGWTGGKGAESARGTSWTIRLGVGLAANVQPAWLCLHLLLRQTE